MTSDTEDIRKNYARTIAAQVGIRSKGLEQALATVPRERFLGPGPWTVARIGAAPDAPGDDPVHIYADVSVALDQERSLYNGNPGNLITWIDALELPEGGEVFHLGGGAGYYTAIMAEMVGASGRVRMAEVDTKLGNSAKRNLAAMPSVEVIVGDGGACDPGPCDAILINAGVTHPRPEWLRALKDGGRMILPLTMQFPNSSLGKGAMFLVTRKPEGFAISLLAQPVVIYSCTSVRDAAVNQALGQWWSSQTGSSRDVRSLRVDAHQPASTCCLHTDRMCLSAEPV